MLKVLLLILGISFPLIIEAKVTVAISDQEKGIGRTRKNLANQQEQVENKTPKNSDALKK